MPSALALTITNKLHDAMSDNFWNFPLFCANRAKDFLVIFTNLASFGVALDRAKERLMQHIFKLVQLLFCRFVLSLADVDPHLLMEDESLVWTSNDVVIVLQHQSEKIPLR